MNSSYCSHTPELTMPNLGHLLLPEVSNSNSKIVDAITLVEVIVISTIHVCIVYQALC